MHWSGKLTAKPPSRQENETEVRNIPSRHWKWRLACCRSGGMVRRNSVKYRSVIPGANPLLWLAY
jgi:hypothetical protein